MGTTGLVDTGAGPVPGLGAVTAVVTRVAGLTGAVTGIFPGPAAGLATVEVMFSVRSKLAAGASGLGSAASDFGGEIGFGGRTEEGVLEAGIITLVIAKSELPVSGGLEGLEIARPGATGEGEAPGGSGVPDLVEVGMGSEDEGGIGDFDGSVGLVARTGEGGVGF